MTPFALFVTVCAAIFGGAMVVVLAERFVARFRRKSRGRRHGYRRQYLAGGLLR